MKRKIEKWKETNMEEKNKKKTSQNTCQGIQVLHYNPSSIELLKMRMTMQSMYMMSGHSKLQKPFTNMVILSSLKNNVSIGLLWTKRGCGVSPYL